MLTVEDLVAPSLGARCRDTARVLALHFHPDARKYLKVLRSELEIPAFPIGDDLLLMDADQMDEIAPVLILATELAKPRRDLIRGAVIEGPGRWSSYGVLGPLGERAEREARYRTWGKVDELGDLPEPMPEPPSAKPAWAAVGVLAMVLAATIQFAITTAPSNATDALTVDFTEGRGGVWSAFDAPEKRW